MKEDKETREKNAGNVGQYKKKTYLIYKHRWNRILDQWDSSGLKQNHRRAKAMYTDIGRIQNTKHIRSREKLPTPYHN